MADPVGNAPDPEKTTSTTDDQALPESDRPLRPGYHDPYRGQRISHSLVSFFYLVFLVGAIAAAVYLSQERARNREEVRATGGAGPAEDAGAAATGGDVGGGPGAGTAEAGSAETVPDGDEAGGEAAAETTSVGAGPYDHTPVGSGRFEPAAPDPATAGELDVDRLTQAANYANHGQRLFREGRDDEALSAFETSLSIWPNAVAHRGVGLVHVRHEEYRRAIRSFTEAIRLDPMLVDVYSNVGFCWMRLTRYDRAEDYLRAALDIDPNYNRARANLGMLYISQDRFEEARDELLIAVSQQPDSLDIRSNLAYSLTRLDDGDGAIEQLNKVIELNPRVSAAYFSVAMILADRGEIDAAFDWIRRGAPHAEIAKVEGWLLDSKFDDLRRDPRYAAFLSELRAAGEPAAAGS